MAKISTPCDINLLLIAARPTLKDRLGSVLIMFCKSKTASIFPLFRESKEESIIDMAKRSAGWFLIILEDL